MDLQKVVWVEQQEILTQSLIANELNCRQLSMISHRTEGRQKPEEGNGGGGCCCSSSVLLPGVSHTRHNGLHHWIFGLFLHIIAYPYILKCINIATFTNTQVQYYFLSVFYFRCSQSIQTFSFLLKQADMSLHTPLTEVHV